MLTRAEQEQRGLAGIFETRKHSYPRAGICGVWYRVASPQHVNNRTARPKSLIHLIIDNHRPLLEPMTVAEP